MTVPPRLLVVAPSAELYGSDRALLTALPSLAGAFAVTLAVPTDGPAVERARALGVEVIALPDYAIRRRHLEPRALGPWVWRMAVAVARLHQRHRRGRFDLLYSNTLAAGIGPALKALWRIPHVVHVHECPTGPTWFVRSLLRLARLTSDRVICNSRFTLDFLVAREPWLEARTTVVHNGIELPEPDGRPEGSDALRVTCPARIHPKKGHSVLAEAVRRCQQQGRRIELHLFGDNLPEHTELRHRLERQVDEGGIGELVTWHGFTETTATMYRDCDVAVVPSVIPEEFSLVCVEAQSMRLPVVVTGPSGASEVIRDGQTGLIVPPGDPEALVTALSTLHDDPERRQQMGERGRRRMLTHFGRERYADRVRDLCLETVRARP